MQRKTKFRTVVASLAVAGLAVTALAAPKMPGWVKKRAEEVWSTLWAADAEDLGYGSATELRDALAALVNAQKARIDDVVDTRLATINQRLTALEVLFGRTSAVEDALEEHGDRLSTVESQVSALGARMTTGESDVDSLTSRVSALESLLAAVSLTESGKTLQISGVNVRIISGAGTTEATPNGYGNLIVGYSELRNNGTDTRTGSHNIVVGAEHNFSSYGCLIVGKTNDVSAQFSSVCAGTGNVVTNFSSSIGAGRNNRVEGSLSCVSAGASNWITGSDSNAAWIGGGSANRATTAYGTVVGGSQNRANGYMSSVLGGLGNQANADYSSVSGGDNNRANGNYSSVSGGHNRSVSGQDDWCGGTYFSDN